MALSFTDPAALPLGLLSAVSLGGSAFSLSGGRSRDEIAVLTASCGELVWPETPVDPTLPE